MACLFPSSAWVVASVVLLILPYNVYVSVLYICLSLYACVYLSVCVCMHVCIPVSVPLRTAFPSGVSPRDAIPTLHAERQKRHAAFLPLRAPIQSESSASGNRNRSSGAMKPALPEETRRRSYHSPIPAATRTRGHLPWLSFPLTRAFRCRSPRPPVPERRPPAGLSPGDYLRDNYMPLNILHLPALASSPAGGPDPVPCWLFIAVRTFRFLCGAF